MAWRIVKQPNGFFARFSDIVDDFTHMNMTEAEALEVCKQEGCGEYEAAKKMKAGIEDHIPWTDTPSTGTSRWEDCLETIEVCHGKKVLKERVALAFVLTTSNL